MSLRKTLLWMVVLAVLLSACTMSRAATPTMTATSAAVLPGDTPTVTLPAAGDDAPAASATPFTEISPTATLVPATNTPLPPTDTPTPTLPADFRQSLGNPTFLDTFTDNRNWAPYSDTHVKMEIKDGAYSLVALNADYYNAWNISWPKTEDFYLEMSAQSGACSGLDRYGIVFRSQDGSNAAYLLGLSCDGRYAVWYWNGEKETSLIGWKKSDLIAAGADQTNRLGIWGQGDAFKIYINGVQADAFNDATFAAGRFGVFVGAVDTADYTVKIDEFAYWNLK